MDDKIKSKLQRATDAELNTNGEKDPITNQYFGSPSKKNPSSNLGKFLHPKKNVPAGEANGTVDANTGGAKVRATQ